MLRISITCWVFLLSLLSCSEKSNCINKVRFPTAINDSKIIELTSLKEAGFFVSKRLEIVYTSSGCFHHTSQTIRINQTIDGRINATYFSSDGKESIVKLPTQELSYTSLKHLNQFIKSCREIDKANKESIKAAANDNHTLAEIDPNIFSTNSEGIIINNGLSFNTYYVTKESNGLFSNLNYQLFMK